MLLPHPSSQRDAAEASQCSLHAAIDTGLIFKTLPAPSPDDINWPALETSLLSKLVG